MMVEIDWELPEKGILAATLESRVKGALGHGNYLRGGSPGARRKGQIADRNWLFSDEDYEGSATYICDVLGINIDYVRRLYRKCV